MSYQYETSPRKLQPEYDIPRNKKVVKKQIKKQAKKTAKKHLKPNVKAIIYVAIGFSVLFTIGYRNSLITVTFNKKEALKKDLGVIQKENEQLRVEIEQSLNLTNIEQTAKDTLGMQKLDNSQKKYINLPKKDYIEPAVEEVQMDEDGNWLNNIIQSIFGE